MWEISRANRNFRKLMNWGEQSGSPAGRFLIRALYTYPLPACPKVQTRESVHGKTARQQTTKDKQKKTDIDHSEILFSADGNLRDSSGYPFCFFHFFFGRPGFSGYYAVLYRNVCAVSYPQDSLNEVTAFILDVLQSHASYTLTPGRAPVNQDIVEYFLFENHEGYCVHFASAATLMYRLYGIPARYASGYAVEPSAFTQQEVIRFFSSPALIRAAFTVLAVCFLAVLFFLHCRRKKRIKKLKQMTEIVRRAAYGQTEPSEKETEFVRAVYCRTAEFLREKQRGFRKLRFRYTKAFY